MIKKLKIGLTIIGFYFVVHAGLLYEFTLIPEKTGFLINIMMLSVDILGVLSLGAFFIITGLLIESKKKIIVTGYVVVFTCLTMFLSVVFNFIVKPYPLSYGRVVTFHFQAIGRLFSPPFLIELLIILAGILFIAASIYWFRVSIVPKIENSI